LRESSVEQVVVACAEARGGVAWKLNPAWTVGIPDRLVLLPPGRVVFVETKSEDGRVRKKQAWIHEKLRAMGFRVEIPWTTDEVRELFKQLDREATCARS
jgi:hypothetical protein